MKKFAFLLVLIIASFSCEKVEKLQDDEYLVFGTYNGYCLDNCTNLFKIEGESLYRVLNNTFIPGTTLTFSAEPLPDSKYELAKVAYEELPSKLIETNEKSFGCPGCVDQDIILIMYHDGAELHEWLIDTEISAIPEYLRAYAEEIIDVVGKLD